MRSHRSRAVVGPALPALLVAALLAGRHTPAGAEVLPGGARLQGDALRRAEYQVLVGDVNDDGRRDLLLRARPRLFLAGPRERQVPVPLAPPSPTFVLLSAGSTFSMQTAPAASLVSHPAWVAGQYELAFGDVLGDGSEVMLIRALEPGGVTVTVADSAAGGEPRILQVLTPAGLGVDLGADGVTAQLEPRNEDTRADLVVRQEQGPPLVFLARSDGTFAPSADGRLQATWLGFLDALDNGNVSGALGYVDANVQEKYRTALENLGTQVQDMSRFLSGLAVVEVGPYIAQALVTQTFGPEPRAHFITFLWAGDRWVLGSF